ncbi:hypothetical protein P43SY_007665 [Pythium insidiosum]|uniref:Cytochrome b5 heme-binding domain-containing protein n=1 Tax=Pythium insidiosum TaxID=114742 RepID=A0AAD5ME49_PYTIN|nr:hypothetical protein P43SY_007665 [Pythium insidiosum]KAJ0410089.1 hypothetical protein ATCC90586_004939 [Pythium insidiosum]
MVDQKPPRRLISWREVRAHNTRATAWLVIHHKVYDVSQWEGHPGGHVVFTQAGEDATDAFAVFHPTSAFALLEQFYIGDVDESTRGDGEPEPESAADAAQRRRTQDFIAAYRKLRLQVKRLGLYEASLLYYAWKVVSTFGLWLAAAALCVAGQSTPVYLLAGAVLGLFYQQSGWLAHDFLHHQVFKNHVLGDLVGVLVGNVWQGFSVQWWKNKHNTHHAVPNIHGHDAATALFAGDPDIDTVPLLAWSKEMAALAADSAVGRFFVRHQAVLYFPLLLLARLSWMLQSFLYAFRGFAFYAYDPVQHEALERAGLLVHYAWNVALPYAAGMSLGQGVAFFLTSQATCGLLLALVFSLGHNGMAVYERERKPDFWQLQVSTTRNIKSSLFMDWFTGGLNYQIDHHLFPMLPRHNLHKVNVLIKSLCKEFDLPFHETGFWDGLGEVVGHLGHISKEFIADFPAM